MNVFEDLLVELQEENLLEQTVIDKEKPPRIPFEPEPGEVPEPAFLSDELAEVEPAANGHSPDADVFDPDANGFAEIEEAMNSLADVDASANGFGEVDEAFDALVGTELAGNELVETEEPAVVDESIHITAESDPPAEPAQMAADQMHLVSDEAAALFHEPEPTSPPKRAKQPRKKDTEFFQKRAVAEVAGLQMVDHVLTGVEREYMKVVPTAFDDFNAKKALNAFLQAGPEGQAEAEFALMQETELWCSALAARDVRVPVSSLRLYCDNTKPALSSQAMLSIARFYRNLPYSEPVRAKFDFVMTRLFSHPAQDGKRICLFDAVESLDHINTLYGEWSSVPLYSADDDESKVMLTALSFEDLAVEAENASSFDQLIESDFFGRLRLFKESIAELFFAPSVTSAAIDANVRIGNAYVVLIAREREKLDSDSVQSKYIGFDDQSVSDAAGQSLGLVDLLTRKAEAEENSESIEIGENLISPDESMRPVRELDARPKKDRKKKDAKAEPARQLGIFERVKDNARNVNRWFLLAAGLIVAASFAIYFWSNFLSDDRVSTTGVAAVSIQVAGFSEHVNASKVSNGTLYVHLRDTWEALPKKKRLDLIEQVQKAGEREGWERVHLLAFDGKQAGFASATRVEVPEP